MAIALEFSVKAMRLTDLTFRALLILFCVVFRTATADEPVKSHLGDTGGRHFLYSEPPTNSPLDCQKLRENYDSRVNVETALAPDSTKRDPQEKELLDCYRTNWRQLLARLSLPNLKTKPFADDYEFNSYHCKVAFRYHQDEYKREVEKFRSEFATLLPQQTSDNLILWNDSHPPDPKVISQYKGRDFYNIFQYNFELPSEILRFRAFLEENFVRFPPKGVDAKQVAAHVPDFSKLVKGIVAMGRFSPKAYREFRYFGDDRTHGGCGPFCLTLSKTLRDLGLDANSYRTGGLSIGGHVILGIDFEGKLYLVDPTVSQYSRFNLTLVTTIEPVIATMGERDKCYEHFAMDGYMGLYVGRALEDAPVRISRKEELDGGTDVRSLVQKDGLKEYFSGLITQFDASAKEGKFPEWQPIIQQNRKIAIKEMTLKRDFSLEEAKEFAQIPGNVNRFGALFDLGHRFGKDPGSLSLLIPALRDPLPEVRFVAALALKPNLTAETRAILQSVATRDTNRDVRNAAHYVLGNLVYEPNPEVDRLLPIFLKGEDKDRAKALQDLSSLGEKAESAIPALVSDLRQANGLSWATPTLFSRLGSKPLPAIVEASLLETTDWRFHSWLSLFQTLDEMDKSEITRSALIEQIRRGYGE